MKKMVKKKILKKAIKPIGILPILFIITLLALFSETVRTLPAGALSENFFNLPYKIPKLNSDLIGQKFLKNDLKIKKNFKNEAIEEIFIAKIIESDFSFNEVKVENQEIIIKEEVATKEKEIVDVPKVKETIKMAADTSTSSIMINGQETLIPGSSEKNITYMQILQKPNDLDLNLKYAQQQGKLGNYKQTIATLERLAMLYPENVEIKLYLLSVLVQADSPNKALTIIEEIKKSEDLTAGDLETVNEIESEMKSRGKPKLWNFYADISIGGIQNQNVNSVSKTGLKSSSDEVIDFTSPKYDRTYSESLGFTALRAIGEASSVMFNLSGTYSHQDDENTDDFDSLGLTVSYDTSVGNHSISPYFMLSQTDYAADALSTSIMGGIGDYISLNDKHAISYGYSYSDSKGNQTSSYGTADETNSIGHSYYLTHDYMATEVLSTSINLGYGDSDAKVDTNDFENFDLGLRLNFALPKSYISIVNALSLNEYSKKDTSINSNNLRADLTNTFDIMFTKSVGDIIPTLDPNKSAFFTISYEKIISESNILNYDYIANSFSFGFTKSIHLNK